MQANLVLLVELAVEHIYHKNYLLFFTFLVFKN